MSDRWILVAALSAWTGAAGARSAPAVLVGVVAVVAIVVRHPVPACAALHLAAGVLGARALAGLDPPPDGPFEGTLTIVTDPEPTVDGRLRFEVSSVHGRLLAEVRSPTAVGVLAGRLAGERATVVGTASAFARPSAWARSRHLAGRLQVESVRAVGPAAPPAEAANRFRRLLDGGAISLPDGQRALLAGLVLGDDRAQPPELSADFRAAGLTHLLAVSGQNVLFVLVVVGPALRWLRIWPRFVVAVAVIAGFALLTRFEPSVVRAVFVAGVALFARTTGRPSGGVRHLGIAVCLLLLVDPLLIHSLGFRLSVAASLGVLLLAPRIAARLRGPTWFRDGLAVTAGAQLAVAPILVPVFGPMPLAALPANIAAGPIAAGAMVWGLTAGVVAGLAGGPLAWILHRPTALALGALEAVAMAGATLPLGRVDLRHLAVLGVAGGLAWCSPRIAMPWVRSTAAALVAAIVIAPSVTPEVAGPRPAGHGATVWVDGPVAVVDVGPFAAPVDVLDALRDARVAAVGLVVVRTTRAPALAVLDAIDRRFPVGAVIAPPELGHPDAVSPPAGFRARVGRMVVSVDQVGPPMRVRIGWAPIGSDEGAAGRPAPAHPAIGSTGALGARPPPLRHHPPRRRPGIGGGRRGGLGRRTRAAGPDRRRRRGRCPAAHVRRTGRRLVPAGDRRGRRPGLRRAGGGRHRRSRRARGLPGTRSGRRPRHRRSR